ncbi:MAG: bifunctional acetaldehyde-CoA/alcohol dehydrogenase [Candidatus Abyssobacteria bacterium SURF_17]|uniref:Aldehyde-alcohol dehydrogenase n=1 Tax=Candidatus Abyssobacteria bacterium SURF_17 TaxID=2093361 RepID=A0A419EW53_9BACT|nr:MAG: bifunctional acetaldehyde-CoA/alcohol dehydrogenase [Candidatus Abyssubacteria bacterium SURF_17]
MSIRHSRQPLSTERKIYLDNLVERAKLAAAELAQFSQEQVDTIVKAMVMTGLRNAKRLARLAVDESKLGIFEDKVLKNFVATEFVWNHIKDKRTVGVIREYPERNLVEVAEPIGVIFSITPITNPTGTVLFKCITCLKTRNALIFSPHFRTMRCCAEAARVMAEAAEKTGAPEGVIACIEQPTVEDTRYLFNHPDIQLIDATGGTSLVKAAYSTGKPALGVGAGNTPCYLHKSADIDTAVVDVIVSKTFDNGTVCASEQTIAIDDEIYEEVIAKFAALGAHIASEEEVKLLEDTVIHPETGMMHPLAVGQSAQDIAKQCGISVSPNVRLIIAPLKGVGKGHPLSVEKLFPVLGVLPVKSVDDAINVCLDVSYNGGVGHTASVFATDEEVIQKFASALNAGRIVVNSPATIGGLGGVYNDLSPTFSFGCGTGGGNITMDNLNIYHYMNIKRVARRTPGNAWFRLPNQIYFNLNSLENLRGINSETTVIISTKGAEKRGHVDIVRGFLKQSTHTHTFSEVEPEPSLATVLNGVRVLNNYKPDHIIAVGGGSVIDAAKAMRLFYENPDVKFEELSLPFLDPRKRVTEYPPPPPDRPKLVAVPTTSGTGSEVTPFAVVTDCTTNRKVMLSDYSLVPDVAIVDPVLVMNLPPSVTADTGMDVLTHAIEAHVSIAASRYTDSLTLQAIRLVFNYLLRAYNDPADYEARENMHNASCIAGIAISNAFVGVNHALAHSLGATFNIPHGRANGVLLPYTVKYNSSIPTKFMPHPNIKAYIADKKYAEAATFVGLKGVSTREKVDALIEAIVDLLEGCGMPTSLKGLGISKQEFENALPELIDKAFDDPSCRSNPRYPMVDEVEELFRRAYDGKLEHKV